MFCGFDGTSTAYSLIDWDFDNLYFEQGGSAGRTATSNAKYRDPSAWYNLTVAWNGSGSTASDRIKVWVNGEAITFSTNATTTAQTLINTAVLHTVGVRYTTGTSYFKGYMAEVHFVDGQALPPADFAEFNADGVWVPKKVEGVTYGNNGFYLDFSDPADIGADRSGNGNNWTATGFELANTSSTSYDWMADSPTNNHGTFNPLVYGPYRNTALSNANLKANFSPLSSGTPANPAYCTIEVPKSGRYYLEWTSSGAINYSVKVVTKDRAGLSGEGAWGYSYLYQAGYPSNGGYITLNSPATASNTGSVSWYGSGTVHGVEFDMDNNTLRYTQNGNLFLTQSNCNFADFEKLWFAIGTGTNGISGSSPNINTGQLPFQHQPSGSEPLSTASMPDVPIKNPSEHFQTILDTGANILTNAQATFPSGLWWIKDRANTNQHQLVDSVRGGNQSLNCPDVLTQTYVAPAGSSVAWCWGTDATGLNADAGFQMIRYTGNGNNGRTVAHSLNRVPGFVIVKPIGQVGGNDWGFLCQYAGNTGTGNLSLNANIAASYSVWGGINPLNSTSSFSLYQGSSGITNVNANGGDYMAYVWAPVPGYSAMGQYVGNANEDGPFIYTGFKPAWIMTKVISGLNDRWQIQDTARNPYNGYNSVLKADAPEGEESNFAWTRLDILSNGFKMRGTDSSNNGSGIPYFYIAFAEHPFGGANVSPSPAR